MADRDHYKPTYGAWAGKPAGTKPDLARCCKEVPGGASGMIGKQCSRKRGYGPSKAYCKQHAVPFTS